jgi:hypothetical protein
MFTLLKMSPELLKSQMFLPGCQLGRPDFGSSCFKEKTLKKIRQFFMHVKGVALDPSGFLAPPLGLLSL